MHLIIMKPRSRFRGLTMFVTVGSTSFDELINKILEEDTINQILKLGFTKLIMQTGNSQYDQKRLDQLRVDLIANPNNELDLELYDYKSSISVDIDRADVIVGHAGAGTCLEALRNGKRLLIVVNEKLMDNHQRELADQLSQDNFVVQTTVTQFDADLTLICNRETKLSKFPPKNPAIFEKIFDNALKKVTSRL